MSRPSVLLLVLLSLCGSEVTRGDGEMAPLLGNEATDKIPDEYVVLLDNVHGSPQQVSDSLTEWVTQQVDTNQCHFSVRRPFELGQRLFLHVDACSDAVLAVRRHEHVTQVETNRIFRLTATPGAGSEECDELRQTVPWGLSRIGARSEGTDDGAGVKTFIVDTGIEVGHEGFRQGNAFWAYTSQGLIRTGNVDKDGHGTHVAGTVAGETTGVAPRAEVRAVKACNADGRCSLSDLIDSVTWVCGLEYRRLQDVTGLARPKVILLLAQDSRLLNSSVGRALEQCVEYGVNIVIGAGNQALDACEGQATRVRGVTVVGAMDRGNNIPHFSNFGKCVDVYAPGVDILSAKADPGNPGSRCYVEKSGTSMSAAHVTGAMATYMSGLTEAPPPHEMTRWVEYNSLLVSTMILSQQSPATVRRLYIAGDTTGDTHVNPDTTPRPPGEDGGSSNQKVLIAAVTSSVIFFFIIVILTVYLCRMRKRRQRRRESRMSDRAEAGRSPGGTAEVGELRPAIQQGADPVGVEEGKPDDTVDKHSDNNQDKHSDDNQEGKIENNTNYAREMSVDSSYEVVLHPDQHNGVPTVYVRPGNVTGAAQPTDSRRSSSSAGSLADEYVIIETEGSQPRPVDNHSRTSSAYEVTCDDVDGPRATFSKSPKNKQKPMSAINIRTGSSRSLSRPTDGGEPAAQPLLSAPAEDSAPSAGTSGEGPSVPARNADSLAGGADLTTEPPPEHMYETLNFDDAYCEPDTIP